MWAILWKDLRIEWRTKEMLSSFAILALLLLLTFSFARESGAVETPGRLAGVLWVTFLFTGMLGVQRSFLLERENGCLSGILVSPADPGEVFLGKLVANVVFLGLTQAAIVPLAALFMSVWIWPAVPALALVLALGNLGFAAVATLFTAMTVRTRAREVMLPLLILPLLLPVVIVAVGATGAVLAGRGLGEAGSPLMVLVAFDVIYCVAGWLCFEFVVRE
jgi:heme exporter protein B